MKYSKTEINECKEQLLKLLKPGDVVYTDLKHVSRSGMYRVIKLMICRDGEIRDISGLAWRFAVSTTRRLHGLEHHPDVQEAQRVLVALMLRDVGPWTGIEFAGSRDAGDWCYFRWRYKSFKGFSHFLTHSHDFEKRINYRC